MVPPRLVRASAATSPDNGRSILELWQRQLSSLREFLCSLFPVWVASVLVRGAGRV